MDANWLLVLHVTGDFFWIAGLTAVLAILQMVPQVEEKSRAALLQAGMRLAIVMDIGATLAIAMGLWFAVKYHSFSQGGWLHVKLTAVVVGVLSTHGIARAKLKKFRNGDLRPVPGAMWILLVAGVLTAIVFGAHKTLMR